MAATIISITNPNIIFSCEHKPLVAQHELFILHIIDMRNPLFGLKINQNATCSTSPLVAARTQFLQG